MPSEEGEFGGILQRADAHGDQEAKPVDGV